MLCFANEKLTIKTKIPKPEVGRGYPFLAMLLFLKANWQYS